ncbi:MAG: hypothetical protein NTZ25_00780 [Candidatus Peregrinibacteria bacterium]|nr:hypothetical protein [Candidatus Peregrinibacteria bacterium]
MKKMFSKFILAVAMSMFIMPVSQAAVFKQAENLLIPEKILDDAYVVANNGSVDADVMNDLYITGGNVTINGNVGQDLVVAGGRVVVMGDVIGDIRVMGGEVSIYGKVGEDVLAAGGQVEIGKKAFVNGNMYVAAGALTLDGQVKGELKGFTGKFILNGTVGKDVNVTAEDDFIINPAAKVLGNLDYKSREEITVPQDVVKGKTTFAKVERGDFMNKFTGWFLIHKFFVYLSSLLLALLFVLYAPKFVMSAGEKIHKSALKAFGLGLLAMLAVMIGGIILMVTMVGIPLALIAFAGLMMSMYIGQIFIASWIGGMMFSYKKGKVEIGKRKLFGIWALALFIYHVVCLIPFVGWAANMVLCLTGLGSLVMTKVEYMSFLKSKKML